MKDDVMATGDDTLVRYVAHRLVDRVSTPNRRALAKLLFRCADAILIVDKVDDGLNDRSLEANAMSLVFASSELVPELAELVQEAQKETQDLLDAIETTKKVV